MAHGYIDVYAMGGGGEESRQLRSRSGAQGGCRQLAWVDSGMGETNSPQTRASPDGVRRDSCSQTASSKFSGSRKRPLLPEPYDPLSFPRQELRPEIRS